MGDHFGDRLGDALLFCNLHDVSDVELPTHMRKGIYDMFSAVYNFIARPLPSLQAVTWGSIGGINVGSLCRWACSGLCALRAC